MDIRYQRSISFRTSSKSTSLKHNNRTPEDVGDLKNYGNHLNKELTSHNKFLIQKPLVDVYHDEFSDAVKEYNKKQRRKERKISESKNGYLKKVKVSNTLDVQREFITQFGTKEDQEKMPISEDDANDMYSEYLDRFKKEFPDMKIYNAVVHHDEATPHLHFNVVPVAEGYKRGMSKQPSFSKVLKAHDMDMKEFCDWNRDVLGEIMADTISSKRKLVGSHDYIKPQQYRNIMSEADSKADAIVSNANYKASSIAMSASSTASETISYAELIRSSYASINSLASKVNNVNSISIADRSIFQSSVSVAQSSTSTVQDSREASLFASELKLNDSASRLSSLSHSLNMKAQKLDDRSKELDDKEARVDSKIAEMGRIRQFIADNLPNVNKFLKWSHDLIRETKEAIDKHDEEAKQKAEVEIENKNREIEQKQETSNLFGSGLDDLQGLKNKNNQL